MSTFLQLYGDELDRELGSADRATLFTLARRKAAINAGQLEFVRRTECLTRQTSVTLVTGTQEYDLEATIADFGWITKQGVSIKIVEGLNTRYIEGDDLIETTVERLTVEEPGWRAVSAGTPTHRYLRHDGGLVSLGLYPAPSFSTGTWTAIVPYVVVPTEMSGDSDVPFAVSGNAVASLAFYHRALAYWGAHDLEQYRKDQNREGVAYQKFEAEIEKYIIAMKPKQGRAVRFSTQYRQPSPVRSWMRDPRKY